MASGEAAQVKESRADEGEGKVRGDGTADRLRRAAAKSIKCDGKCTARAIESTLMNLHI